MTSADPILYLDEATTGWLLARVDPVGVAARVLADPPADLVATSPPAGDGLVVVADPAARRVVCVISSRRFREVCVAGAVSALARSLAGPLPVVCVLGDGRREVSCVEHLLRSVPGIVQLVVCRSGPVPVSPEPDPRGGHGATVAVTGSVREALEGAELVLIIAPPRDALDPRWLARDAAVVDATGVVDLAPLGARLSHAVSAAELAVVATGLAAAAYRAALSHVVGVRLPR
ncbi:hypothetical protein Asp14428_22900 [Actinoplanes sp. NBRC 14428]|nr:hypothetical protein Asp14428_22900 [Actinoplanes sp. NBRC 14428]